jgi:hypothetical protein
MNTPTEKDLDALLTPPELLDVVDPLEGTVAGLVPDALRGGEDEEPELPTKAKTPTEQTLEDLRAVKVSVKEWIEKKDALFEEEKKILEEETADIKKSFRKVAADDLTPDNLK